MLHCDIRSLLSRSMRSMTNSAKAGTQVVVPFREEDEKRHLRVTGDLGQIVPFVCDFPRFSPQKSYARFVLLTLGMGYPQRRADLRVRASFRRCVQPCWP